MNVVSRGIRNALRNPIRTFSIVLILGLSLGMALAMQVARQAVNDKVENIKTTIGNTITVTPAGAQGFQGGGEPLTTEQVSTIESLDNVIKVQSTLSDRLTSDNTNLTSAIEAGSLGNRAGNNSGVGFMQGPPPEDSSRPDNNTNSQSTTTITRTFTPPLIVTGTSSIDSATIYGGDAVTFTAGNAFDPNKDENVAVVGSALAEKNSLGVGSTFTAYGETVTVVGIYDAGSTFSNAGLVMPLVSLQRISDQSDSITSATVTVNSIDNIDSVVTSLESALGESADVVSNQESAENAIAPLENVKTISSYSLAGAVLAGAVIILLTMVMIVRERRREIGVLKAIGSSNVRTMLQFVFEAMTLTALALIIGIIIGVAASSPITNVLVSNSTNSSDTQQAGQGRSPRGPGGIRGISQSAQNVHATVGIDILMYGMGAAMIIAIVGSAIPALLISKIRPAEVMRAE